MCLIAADGDPIEKTTLTERQVRILRLREGGRTQQEIADQLGTTASNISAIESAARSNIEKAQRTLDLADVIRAPVRVPIAEGASLEEMIDAIYAKGNEAGVSIAHPRPELYAHLFADLTERVDDNRLLTDIEIGITNDGDVTVFEDLG